MSGLKRFKILRNELGAWAARRPKFSLVVLALFVTYGYFHFGLDASSWIVLAWRAVTLLIIFLFLISPHDRIKAVRIENSEEEPGKEPVIINGKKETASFRKLSDAYLFQSRRNIDKDYDLFLSKILAIIKKTFAAQTAVFYLYKEETDTLNIKSVVSDIEHLVKRDEFPSEAKIFGTIFERNSPFYTNNAHEISGYLPFYENGNKVASLIAAPVIIEDLVRGVVVIDCIEKNAYSDEDLPLIESYAGIISETIVNYNSLYEFEYSAQLFSYFYEISRGLISNLKFQEILDLFVSVMKDVIDYDRLTISEYTSGSDEAIIIRVSGQVDDLPENTEYPLDEGLTGWVIRNRKSKRIGDIEKDDLFLPRYHAKEKSNFKLRSFLGVPVSYHNVCFGAITVESQQPYKYTERDEKILTILANNFGVALERSHALKQLEMQATTDGLTQLYNYRSFMQSIVNEVERSIRYDLKFTLLVIDVDYFKQVNDTHGHLAGDKVLIHVASAIKKNTRNVDIVCRYGGEEFTVILVETSLQDGLMTAERIRENIENMNTTYKENIINITVSIGAVEFPNSSRKSESLINEADKALYEAKSKGRNRIVSAAALTQSVS